MPVGVAEREELRAFGEHFDLAARAQHDADVSARAVVAAAWAAYARAHGTSTSLGCANRRPAPSPDVDDVEQPAVARDEKHRAHAIGQPEEALDRRQRARVVRPVALRRRIGANRIGIAFEQQHAGRNRLVLVARERRDAQHLEHFGDALRSAAVGARRVRRAVEKRADVAILDRAAKQPGPLDHQLRD